MGNLYPVVFVKIDRTMWIFRKNRAHISLETLSEYIDGRLSSGEHEKVERHLEGCYGCSAELESLRSTVSLLRRTPMRNPRRVYTLAEAPPLPSMPWKARVPVWAYGTAASVVIALFALVLSADLSGSLAGDESGLRAPDQEQASPAASERSELMSDSEAAKPVAVPAPTTTSEPQPTAMVAAPTSTPIPQVTVVSGEMAEPALADAATSYAQEAESAATTISSSPPGVTPTPQPTSMPEAAAMEGAPTATPIPQAAAVSREASAMTDDDASPPIDSQVAKEVASSISISTPPPAATPLPTPAASPTIPTVVASPTVANRLVDRFEQGATPMPTVAPSPTLVPAPTIPLSEVQLAPTPEFLAQEASSVEAEDGSTSIVWRVLEVVLGAAAVVLVGGVLWRLRYRRGRTIS
ncbi:MAG: zf-HC2 domain-containing protein [Dehalococcoidia bacterium]|nr:zf-HC2 domain-containing protein [Dehalococcoidia bacterium]